VTMQLLAKLATLMILLVQIQNQVSAQAPVHLQVGDLVFQDLDCGEICDAIELVTQGLDGAKLSHVAIVSQAQGPSTPKTMVIEAYANGVVELPLEDLLKRSQDQAGNPKVIVSRLKGMSQESMKSAISKARAMLGRPYDQAFSMLPDAVYCAELIHHIFQAAPTPRGDLTLFPSNPMTFKHLGMTLPTWVKYYEKLGQPIPEGELGLNPGNISNSKNIELICSFGKPSGWSGKKRPCAAK
jgi:Permuted papain-like amidase enzyme, YaeF/YiiX, C92 family